MSNPNIFNVLESNKTLELPVLAGDAISIGDLCYWDTVNNAARPITKLTTAASEALDQAQVAKLFIGVALDVTLSSETAPPLRLFLADGVCDCACPSATFNPGDYVGATWNGGSALVTNYVKGVANLFLAIGRVTKYFGSAGTTVRARLQSRYAFDLASSARLLGAMQGTGSKTVADGAYAILVSDPPILISVPTAGRNWTLPVEANSAGLEYQVVNNSAGAFTITVQNSAGNTTIAAVAQNKRGFFYCDGTTWYGGASA